MEQCDHNCEGTICSTTQMYEQWPNEPKTINLLESGLETKLSMSEVESDHNRLVTITGKNKTKSFEQEMFFLVKSEVCLFLYTFLRFIQKFQFLGTQ